MNDHNEVEYLMISGIQHFAFCRRQWGLIHIDKKWADNYHTTLGEQIHERVHDPFLNEKRKDLIIVRGMKVVSHELGITGECDVVEFHQEKEGVPIFGHSGLYSVYPIEYKKGKPKANDEDILQLAAQAVCLEEMFCCSVQDGAIYYASTKRREEIKISAELKQKVKEYFAEMHGYFQKQYIPQVKKSKKCQQCSLKELCIPVDTGRSVLEYIRLAVKEE